MVRSLLREHGHHGGGNDRRFDLGAIVQRISLWKNDFVQAEDLEQHIVDEYDVVAAAIYEAYEDRLQTLGAPYVGVAYLEEGVRLRREGITTPILVLGGLVGEQIPLLARVFQLCDIFDALTNARAYKPGMQAELDALVSLVEAKQAAMSEAVAQGFALGFRPGDAQDLARAIERVTDEPELRANLVANATRIRCIDDCARETLDHYLRLHREVRT